MKNTRNVKKNWKQTGVKEMQWSRRKRDANKADNSDEAVHLQAKCSHRWPPCLVSILLPSFSFLFLNFPIAYPFFFSMSLLLILSLSPFFLLCLLHGVIFSDFLFFPFMLLLLKLSVKLNPAEREKSNRKKRKKAEQCPCIFTSHLQIANLMGSSCAADAP